MLKNLVTNSGGLIYHFRAQRYKNTLWLPFIQSLHQELESWASEAPSSLDTLIVVGGSGGYCLKKQFTEKFQKVILIDRDPLAGFLFRKTHPHSHFQNCDIFENNQIEELKKQHPSAHWLWSNLLGQLGFSQSEEELSGVLKTVNNQMKSQNWFSYHDVYSYSSEVSQQFELMDHMTQGQLALKNKAIHTWQITKKTFHLIESGYSIS